MKNRRGLAVAVLGWVPVALTPGCPRSGESVDGGADGGQRADGGTIVDVPPGQPLVRPPYRQPAIATHAYTPVHVGKIPQGQDRCPAVCDGSAAWRVTRLFDGTAPDQPSDLPEPLERYCVYEPTHEEGRPVPPKAPAAEGCHLDPLVVSEQQSPSSLASYNLQIETWLRGLFRSQVDALSPLPSAPPLTPVRFAVLDSSPSQQGNGLPGRFDHGFNVASIIEDLTCPDGVACAGHLRHYLTLWHLDDGTWVSNGGDVDRPHQVAKSIHSAVADWLGDPSREPHLVVNLSLAWEPKADATQPSPCHEDHAGVQAVQDALRYAACNGALVIAAVGNDPDPDELDPTVPHHYGAMCPARWEATPPAPVSCAGFATPAGGPPSHLLYAAGGVDPGDHPIVVSRIEAAPSPGAPRRVVLPGLVATSQLAVDYPTWSSTAPPEASRPLTGSSLSTAVASSAAGLVWAYAPGKRADEVIATLGTSGAPLAAGVTPSGFFRGTPKRISIQCAVRAALNEPCTPPRATSTLPLLPDALLQAHPDYDPSARKLRVIAEAGKDTLLLPLPQTDDWVGPQPDNGSCGSSCLKAHPPDFDIVIPGEYPGPAPVVAAWLRLYDGSGAVLALVGATSADAYAVDLSPLPPPSAAMSRLGVAHVLLPGSHLTGVPTFTTRGQPALATFTYEVPVWKDGAKTGISKTERRRATQTLLYHP